MHTECELCGERHDDTEHGEAIVILDQCSRNMVEYASDVISEVQSLASQGMANKTDIDKIAEEWSETLGIDEDSEELASEFATDALACLTVPYIETGNDLLIFGK